MQVNGNPFPHRPELTLHALLRELGIQPERVSVAHNEAFYPGTQVPDVPLEAGDVIEVVRVTAGG